MPKKELMSFESLIDSALKAVSDVLHNIPKRVPNKVHNAFLEDEGENIVFLVSRVTHLLPRTQPQLKTMMQFLLKKHIFPLEEPPLWLSLDMLKQSKPQPVISSYASEYPKDVLDAPFTIATRVMVAEGLAHWSFYNKDPLKLVDVVETGLQRFSETKDKDIVITRKSLLSEPSELFIYFVTHIVLVATMWGELAPIGGSHAIWQMISKTLKTWALELDKHKKKNLEVWLELLFCLNLLGETTFTQQFEEGTIALFTNVIRTKNQHKLYHTFVLWSLYLSFYETMLAEESDSESSSAIDFDDLGDADLRTV
jgi:hypothetical protein